MRLKMESLESSRRQVMINAALKEFAAKGFTKASTNVIAKESGISKALMFHYVTSKKDLFLFLYDYCNEMINEEFLQLLNFDEKDILARLRQSYRLQIELMHKHPWIFDFVKMTGSVHSDELQMDLDNRVNEKLAICQSTMFSTVDESKFREGLDIETCKQLIFWANIGFTNQVLEEIRQLETAEWEGDKIFSELDSYLNELKKIFYK